MLFNEPMTQIDNTYFTWLPSQMHKTKIFHIAFISLINSRKITNSKEKSDGKFGKSSWTRPVPLIRQPVKEEYFLDENDLFQTRSTTTLTTPYPTSHNPYIPSSLSTTQATTARTLTGMKPSKYSTGQSKNSKSSEFNVPKELLAVRNLIELEKIAPVKCAQGGYMDTFYYKLENKSGLSIKGMINLDKRSGLTSIKPFGSIPGNEKPQSVSIKYCVAKKQIRRYTIFSDQEGKISVDLEAPQLVDLEAPRFL